MGRHAGKQLFGGLYIDGIQRSRPAVHGVERFALGIPQMPLLGGFARWFPCVWRPLFELREVIVYFMPLSLGTYEDM